MVAPGPIHRQCEMRLTASRFGDNRAVPGRRTTWSLVAIAAVVVAIAAWPRSEAAAPVATPLPADASPEPAAPSAADAPVVAIEPADAADRTVPPEPIEPPDPIAAALFADPRASGLWPVLAEVLAVGDVEPGMPDVTPIHRELRLRLLEDGPRPLLYRYAVVFAPLCPTVSAERFGCSTPLGRVQPGDVRVFLFGRGRPDLGAIGRLVVDRAWWIVLAGPRVPRPEDPLLDAIPPELLGYLGRGQTNLFRGRVRELRRAGQGAPRNPLKDGDRIVVDVAAVVYLGGKLPLGDRVAVSQAPFQPGVPTDGLVVGGDYWFATEDAALWQVLRAFARVR